MLSPIYADLPDTIDLNDRKDHTTPPANEIRILLVRQPTKAIADWIYRHKKVILFLKTGIQSSTPLQIITRTDIIVNYWLSEDDDCFYEHVSGEFSFLEKEELEKLGFPGETEENSVVLAIECFDDTRGQGNWLPKPMLKRILINTTDIISSYSLAELYEIDQGLNI